MAANLFLVLTVEQTIQNERLEFFDLFGRFPTEQDPLFFDRDTAERDPEADPQPMSRWVLIPHIEELARLTCLPPAVIYARHQVFRISDRTFTSEWDDAVKEYLASDKLLKTPWVERGASAPRLSR